MGRCNDSWTGADKRKHFGVCLVLSIISPLLALLAAIGKEIFDETQQGNHFCWKDIAWDALGMVCGGAIHVAIIWLVFS